MSALRLVMSSLAVALTVSSNALAADNIEKVLDDAFANSSSYRVRYLNPEHSPRTIYDVNDISKSQADFDVTVRCFVGTCAQSTKFAEQLKLARTAKEACVGPVYMIIELVSADKSRKKVALDIHRAGGCMTVNGRAYSLRGNIIWTLHTSAVKDW